MFNEKYASFEPFDAAHITAMVISVIAIALCVIFIKKLKLDRFYEKLIGAIMLLLEAVFLVWQFALNSPGPEHLPLELCTMSLYINALSMLFGSEKFVKYSAFFSIVGALIAIAVPMQGYTFPHFRYIHYYLNHLLIVLTSIYLMRTLPKISYKEVLVSEGTLLVMFFINGINVSAGTKFMFLTVKTGYSQTVFAWRNILIYLTAIIAHQICYQIYRLIYKKYKQNKKRGSYNGKKQQI